MRILCKDTNRSTRLEVDREYYVLALHISLRDGIAAYIQAGEENMPIWVSLSGFEVLDQAIPSSWVKKDFKGIDDDAMSYEPANWTHDGFFEDLYDDVESAVKLFNYEAIKIYEELGAPSYRKQDKNEK